MTWVSLSPTRRAGVPAETESARASPSPPARPAQALTWGTESELGGGTPSQAPSLIRRSAGLSRTAAARVRVMLDSDVSLSRRPAGSYYNGKMGKQANNDDTEQSSK